MIAYASKQIPEGDAMLNPAAVLKGIVQYNDEVKNAVYIEDENGAGKVLINPRIDAEDTVKLQMTRSGLKRP